MSPAAQVYSMQVGRVHAEGVQIDAEGILEISVPVRALLTDQIGVEEISEAMSAMSLTQFQTDALSEILSSARPQEEWRIGEALAEYHLSKEFGCIFPWPTGRDLKNPGTSGGGVDLVGFLLDGESVRLTLGEVKTSRHRSTPPSVMTGRHGMQEQLSGLRDNNDRLRWAVRYLAMHMKGQDWQRDCEVALCRYLANPCDISLFGALVRPMEPNQRDLKARCKSLASGARSPISVRLIAIYIPANGLEAIAGTEVTVESAA